MRIGVKYCGNCNPAIDSLAVVTEIAAILPGLTIFLADQPGVDAVLVVCGCRRDCASRPGHNVKTVVIAGNSVDNEECQPFEIAAAAAGKLQAILS